METLFTVLFLSVTVVVSYLLGSIPTARIIGKINGVDITQYGSHNAGGTNVGRVLGWGPAILTMALDALKVYLPCTAVMLVYKYSGMDLIAWPPLLELAVCLVGLFGAIGHSYPIYTHFKGGKCVSCFAGFVLFISPLMFVLGFAIFGLVLLIGKKVSLASITAAPCVLLASLVITILDFTVLKDPSFFNGGIYFNSYYMIHMTYITTITFFLIVALILFRHRSNIDRLSKHTEPKTVFKKKSDTVK